jgi:hypothetical protein
MQSIRALLLDVDGLLRGRFTQADTLRAGKIELPVRAMVLAGVLLGTSYGVFMGLHAAVRAENPAWPALLVTGLKVPLLFLLTLAVTYPSLYVFSALVGSRLDAVATLRLLLGAVAVTLTLLASFGPVTAFFTLSTPSYPFMVVLNVVVFAIAGGAGLAFLRRALALVFPVEDGRPDPGGPRVVFRSWTLVYAVVGAQMAWILRPFIGSPELPFELFRARDSNFFEAVGLALRQLFA